MQELYACWTKCKEKRPR